MKLGGLVGLVFVGLQIVAQAGWALSPVADDLGQLVDGNTAFALALYDPGAGRAGEPCSVAA